MKLNKSLIGFLPAGYPSMKASRELLIALGNEVDVLEVGIPFSDPVADGKVIQDAGYIAIKNGATPRGCLSLISEVKKAISKPIAILTYYNIPYSYGMKQFLADASSSGVDAALIADLNINESDEFEAACKESGVETIFIAAPNTPKERAIEIDSHTTGFVYLLSHFAVTGTKPGLSTLTTDTIRRVKPLVKNPLAVGFGISTREHVKAVLDAGADGAIVGSAFIKSIVPGDIEKSKLALKTLAKELKGSSIK